MINKDKILEGTVFKRISSAHKIMMEHTIDDAEEVFYTKVSELSASEILESSDFIFDEPTKSMDLYESVIKSDCIPYHRYKEELEKVSHFIESHPEMSDGTKIDDRFYELRDYLTEKVKETHCLHVLETKIMNESEDPLTLYENVDLFTDILYKAKKDKENDYFSMLESVANYIPDYATILYTTPVANELGLEPMVTSAIRNVYTENAGIHNSKDWKVCLDTKTFFENALTYDNFANAILTTRNYNFNKAVHDIVYESPIEIMSDIMMESAKPLSENMNAFEAVNEMFSRETTASILQEDVEYDNYEVLCRKLDMYENAMDYLMAESEVSDDPDTLHPENTEFIEAFRDQFGLPDMSINDTLECVIEACAMIEEEKEMYEYTSDGTPSAIIKKTSGYDEQDEMNRKTKNQKVIKSSIDTENPISKPKLPKRSLLEKIQHGAMDLDVKVKALKAKGKQASMNIKNTGKAILKAPTNLVNGWKDMVSKWDAMDDLRREEYIIKPGFRKHYFNGLKTAITYGGAAYASPLLVPVVAICRSLSKKKNMRIRNELTNELATEIKVIDAKIEDASQAGDKKEKYQLMRLRDKLEHEKTRVMTNSKFV